MSLINKSFINKYKKEGFCYGIPIFSKSETKSIRSEIEALEKNSKMVFPKKARPIFQGKWTFRNSLIS